MTFAVNDSPFAGREGQYLTSRQMRARLMNELERNVAMRVQETDKANEFIVSGAASCTWRSSSRRCGARGTSLPSAARRSSSRKTTAIYSNRSSRSLSRFTQRLPGRGAGDAGPRRAEMQTIHYGEDGTVYGTYLAPTRGLLGFPQPFLTATRGTGIYHTLFHAYEAYKGDIALQVSGALVSLETGPVSAYALVNLQQRGEFIVRPGDEVYAGQVVGKNTRDDELVINVCRTKQLTNFREKPSGTTDMLNRRPGNVPRRRHPIPGQRRPAGSNAGVAAHPQEGAQPRCTPARPPRGKSLKLDFQEIDYANLDRRRRRCGFPVGQAPLARQP
jgi:GTP-binding protein